MLNATNKISSLCDEVASNKNNATLNEPSGTVMVEPSDTIIEEVEEVSVIDIETTLEAPILNNKERK